MESMNRSSPARIQVIDTHTGGEPTRVVHGGGPPVGFGSIVHRRDVFSKRFDRFRSAVVNEPRGSDVMVGALLVPPQDPKCVAGVIFFNNIGYLGMCGHGMMGVTVALAHLNRISAGDYLFETPVGIVKAGFDGNSSVSVENVAAERTQANVIVDVPGYGKVTGDVAWGGNWFFLVATQRRDLTIDNAEQLTQFCWSIRKTLKRNGITGHDGVEIDHVELFGPACNSNNHSRNFVLCPGAAYDRSPCGTGTSAKLACLAADGLLQPEAIWRQEGIVGSVFEGSYRTEKNRLIPTIRGTAYVNAETSMLVHPNDPFAWGISGRQ